MNTDNLGIFKTFCMVTNRLNRQEKKRARQDSETKQTRNSTEQFIMPVFFAKFTHIVKNHQQ